MMLTAKRDAFGRFQKSVAVSLRRHRVLNMYWQHWSREEIAAELNITLDMVSAYIRQGRLAGDQRAQPRLQKRVMTAQARRVQIVEMNRDGYSPPEIARVLNCHVKLVKMRLKEARDAA